MSATPENKTTTDAERLFGEIAVRLYFTSRRDLARALKAQRQAREEGGASTIGEVMVGLEILTEQQVTAVLKAQEIYDETNVETLYGKLAVKNGFVTQSNLEAALKVHNRINRRLRIGEVLVKKSYLTWEQHEAILAAQERLLAGLKQKREESARLAAIDPEDASDSMASGDGGKVTLTAPTPAQAPPAPGA